MPHIPQYPDNVTTTKKNYLDINMRRKWKYLLVRKIILHVLYYQNINDKINIGKKQLQF